VPARVTSLPAETFVLVERKLARTREFERKQVGGKIMLVVVADEDGTPVEAMGVGAAKTE